VCRNATSRAHIGLDPGQTTCRPTRIAVQNPCERIGVSGLSNRRVLVRAQVAQAGLMERHEKNDAPCALGHVCGQSKPASAAGDARFVRTTNWSRTDDHVGRRQSAPSATDFLFAIGQQHSLRSVAVSCCWERLVGASPKSNLRRSPWGRVAPTDGSSRSTAVCTKFGPLRLNAWQMRRVVVEPVQWPW